ncbi:cytochrome P450 [Umezawaea sp. Da 62-37]|uniref:cytochrome P450 n=1 Tax=Umezawaea sp. Da 62-37 TaxID=3075927 RepID=UPI0028F71933|nr:cytochrome P450 [Umezawaea sp. Da 62-37]WNV85799.1 cytochrome P450 [Umezawaea sp. Da 62-37]
MIQDVCGSRVDPSELRSPAFGLDPHPVYARLRRTDPVHWNPLVRAWFVTRHADVVELLGEPWLTSRDSAAVVAAADPAVRAEVASVERFFGRWPVFTDPPRHGELRSLLRPAFARSVVEESAGRVAGHAVRAVTALVGASTPLDVVRDLAEPYALAVTADFLGFAPTDLEALRGWSTGLMAYLHTSPVDLALLLATARTIDGFTAHVRDEVLPAGRGPVAAALRRARADGDITDTTAAALMAQLLTGGVAPVATTIAAAVVQLRSGVDRGGSSTEDVVAEALRRSTPFHHAPRTVARDTTWRGHRFQAGQRVALVLASANRDPAVHTDPDSFVAGRGTGHVAFGRGAHHCLGAHLARRSVEALLRAVDAHAPGLRVDAGGVRMSPAAGATVFDRVPVERVR